MKPRLVTVIGGSGFLGRYVVQELARAGYAVQVISRNATRAVYLRPLGSVGQIILRNGDVTRPKTLHGALEQSYAVVNLVGVLFEKGKRQRFSAIHAQCPERLASTAKAAGIKRFVHISALGVDRAAQSHYARSKLTGERAVMNGFPEATILRPGVMFGQEDNFYNQFARMAGFAPALPLIGGGKTRFQPVYVQDVAKAVRVAIERPDAAGQTYELAGPSVYTFRDILNYILHVTDRKRRLITIPFGAAKLMGWAGEWLPKPPLTRDQVRLLQNDSVADAQAMGFADLGISPQPVEAIVPRYLLSTAPIVRAPDREHLELTMHGR